MASLSYSISNHPIYLLYSTYSILHLFVALLTVVCLPHKNVGSRGRNNAYISHLYLAPWQYRHKTDCWMHESVNQWINEWLQSAGIQEFSFLCNLLGVLFVLFSFLLQHNTDIKKIMNVSCVLEFISNWKQEHNFLQVTKDSLNMFLKWKIALEFMWPLHDI